MKKRMAGLLLTAAFVLLAMLSGCGSKEEGGENSIPKGTEEKPAELKLVVHNPIFSKSPLGTEVQKKWQEKMENYLGVKLNITWEEVPWGDYLQQLPTYIAGGDFADVFMINDISKIQDLGDNGLLLDLNKYAESMPNYKKFLDSDPYGREKTTSDKGGMYGFADGTDGNHNGDQELFTVRFDVLQKNNIKPPETFDEIYQVAKQLKSLYPNSYPLGNIDSDMTLPYTFFNMNHTKSTIYFNGKEFVYGPLAEMDRFKEVLVYLNKFYSEGLLDPEFAVNTEEQSYSKMLTDKIFMEPLVYGIQIQQQLNNNKEYPQVKWGVIPNPKNLRGEVSWKINSLKKGKVLSTGFNTVISSKTKNPELIVKMLDYQYSDEMMELANWGIEGLTFTKVDGKRQFKPEILNAVSPQAELAKYGVNMSMSVRSGIQFMPQQKEPEIQLSKTLPVYANGQYAEKNHWLFTDETGGKESIAPSDDINMPPIVFSEDEKVEKNSVMTPVNTFVDESIIKFITGKMSFDQWDNFITDLKKMGDIDSIVKMYNDKYNKVKK